MGVLPRTFKFKVPHAAFYRRIWRVKTVKLVVGTDGIWCYEVTKMNGAQAVVPYTGTVALVGRKVEFTK